MKGIRKMKSCIIQPAYSMDYQNSDAFFQWELDALAQCDASMDLIVLPEYSNVPCLAKTRDQMEASFRKYTDTLLTAASETAKRCGATLFVNCIYGTEKGLRNTTVAFDRTGKQAGCYYKQHLVPSEMYKYELDKDYTWEHSEPTILEIDGVRYGFLICYDAYFYEAFANIARHDPDVIIACSHQRSDSHDALETMTKFCAYNCNAYVVRASVSLGADSPVGGTSLVVAPDGKVLLNMMNEVGLGTAEFDPHARYLKPAGFGNPPATHHSYIEAGRRPWKYRPGGSAIVRHDDIMPYPRLCAHRGFSSVAPENSLPAYGAAVALGAEEIEMDLWASKDGVIMSCHDSKLDRVSNGTGYIWEYTCQELKQFDFGSKQNPAFTGMTIPTFEEILQKFACHVVMNIHIKSPTDERPVEEPLAEETLKEIIRLIYKYDCVKYSYFMSGNVEVLKQLQRLAPEIPRCAGAGHDPKGDLVEKALAAGATRIQLFKPYFKHNPPDYIEKVIAKAHANGIRCNMFFADDPEEARRYLKMGIDTVLTNDYQRIAFATKDLR